jgi:hypothetical protein
MNSLPDTRRRLLPKQKKKKKKRNKKTQFVVSFPFLLASKKRMQLLELPDEMAVCILRFLSPKDIGKFEATSHRSAELARSDVLWLHLLQRDFLLATTVEGQPRAEYVELYSERVHTFGGWFVWYTARHLTVGCAFTENSMILSVSRDTDDLVIHNSKRRSECGASTMAPCRYRNNR